MNHFETRGETIEETFLKFHAKNPEVYDTFKNEVFRALSKGKKKLSAKQIIGYIRWEMLMDGTVGDEFKINDSFTCHYGRMFADHYPQHENLFNFRKLRSITKADVSEKLRSIPMKSA